MQIMKCRQTVFTSQWCQTTPAFPEKCKLQGCIAFTVLEMTQKFIKNNLSCKKSTHQSQFIQVEIIDFSAFSMLLTLWFNMATHLLYLWRKQRKENIKLTFYKNIYHIKKKVYLKEKQKFTVFLSHPQLTKCIYI